jgi:hypothetical protein
MILPPLNTQASLRRSWRGVSPEWAVRRASPSAPSLRTWPGTGALGETRLTETPANRNADLSPLRLAFFARERTKVRAPLPAP